MKMKNLAYSVILVLCLIVAASGYAQNDAPTSKKEKTAPELTNKKVLFEEEEKKGKKEEKEEKEKRKRVNLHKISKSGDPQLMYSTALDLYEQEKWTKAYSMFDACQGYFVGSAQEDSIAYFSARSRFKHREYDDAAVQLDEFRRKFGRSIFLEDAEAMFAMCKYYLTPGPTRDQSITSETIIALTEYMERYPNSERTEAFSNIIEELTGRLKEKSYLNAYTYYKIQKYKSAVIAFRNALKAFPDTPYREKMLYYIVVSNYRLAHNSIESKQAERYLSMLDSYYSFIEEYPESKQRRELERYVKEAKNFIDKNNIDKQR